MKKLLIIPILLALALFSIYHYKIEGKKIYKQPTTMEKMKEEILLNENNSYTSKKQINKKEENLSEVKKFTVEFSSDINTTRDYDTQLTVNVKNADNIDACNFRWYEEDEFLGMGKTITKSFDKGEHIITLKATNSKGEESNATLLLTAWDYFKVKRVYFDTISDSFMPTNLTVYDHKRRRILQNGYSYKFSTTYNEKDQETESKEIYYKHPEWGEIRRYKYTESGEIETTERLTLDEKTISFEKNIYDEEGNLTKTLRGTDQDNLIDYSMYYQEDYGEEYTPYYSDEVDNENSDDDTKIVYNENNQTTYEEYHYGNTTEIVKNEYDENQTLIKSENINTYLNGTNITIKYYDNNENIFKREHIYKEGEEVLCHYRSNLTFNEEGQTLNRNDKILDGNCEEQYIYESNETYTYDENGEQIEVKSINEDYADESYISSKVVKFYSNDLEEIEE